MFITIANTSILVIELSSMDTQHPVPQPAIYMWNVDLTLLPSARLPFTAPIIAGNHSQQHTEEQTENGP